MGQVYRGVDTRLDRVVAIKVLSLPHAPSPQIRERFDREARAISSLSHPNICTLYDVGHQDGIDYLVMEYLEGESLADRLERGPLPMDQVLRNGIQIADALARAHRQGVVHRDLKPGNVMLSRSGAKLLDFGLARTAAATPEFSTEASTEYRRPLTEEGTILGTFQYMAPEQLEGRAADARTDVFALGVLLYEMATGKRPFEGKSRASLIGSILHREPQPVTSLQPGAPAAIERLIGACMAKDPDDRLQSAHDAAMQLRWIGDAAGHGQEGSEGRRWALPAIALVALLLGAGATAAFVRPRGARPPKPVHLSLVPPPGYRFSGAAVSPQGTLVFDGRGKESYLFTRALDDPRPKQVVQTRFSGHPFWSPDSKWIAYFDRNMLMKVPAGGGPPESICASSYGMGGAWREDGTIVFTPGYFQPLHTVPARGGVARPLTQLDARRHEAVHAWPQILPGNGGVLYLAVGLPTETSRIMHLPADGQSSREVIAADAIVGYSEPYLVFVREANIHAIRFDPRKGTVAGEPERIVEQVDYSSTDNTAGAAVTADGTLIFLPQASVERRLVWYGRDGRAAAVALEDSDVSRPRLSPNGKRLLVMKKIHEKGEFGFQSIDLERGVKTLLTPVAPFGSRPVWIDDETLAFSSARRSSVIDIYVQPDDPQGQAKPLWESDTGDDKEALGVTPDGEFLLVREYTPAKLYDVWLVPIRGQGERKLLLGGVGSENEADVSDDGKWIVYSSLTGTEAPEVHVRPFGGGRSARVSTAGGHAARWGRDGKEILFLASDRTLMRATFDPSRGTPSIGLPRPLFKLPYGAESTWELSADGERFLINEQADAATPVTSYSVVTGWKEKLREE